MPSSRPKALGANIFAGGFTLGVSKHFDVVGHLEHDTYGVRVAQLNFPNIQYHTTVDAWPKKMTGLDFLYANPPCAIWSVASGRGGELWKSDPRLQRIRDIFALVEQYRPKVWCWESVCQAFTRGRPFVEELAKQAMAQGYMVTYLLVDAQHLGTPQIRKRFFLVLHRIHIDWAAHKPGFKTLVTVGKALKGVKPRPELSVKESERLQRVIKVMKPGENTQGAWERITPEKNRKRNAKGQLAGRPSFLTRRLREDTISGTVIGNHLVHFKDNRHLSTNEAAALCGYPQTWDWGNKPAHDLVARGVCPPVGEWLASVVAASVTVGKRITKPSRQVVDFRSAPGLIYPVTDLPKQLDLDWQPTKTVAGNVPPWIEQKGGQKKARKDTTAKVKQAKASSVNYDKLSIPIFLTSWGGRNKFRTSKELIREILKLKKFSDEVIAAYVRKLFEGRKTTTADVSWNRSKLRAEQDIHVERIPFAG